MPIKIPMNLPAAQTLRKVNIFVMDSKRSRDFSVQLLDGNDQEHN